MALQKPVRILKMAPLLPALEPHNLEERLSTRAFDAGEKQIEGLYKSYALMKEFAEGTAQEKPKEFGQIVHSYSNQCVDFELSPKSVMHILDKRIQRMLKNKKIKKNWSDEDTKILLWTFSHYAHRHGLAAIDHATLSDWDNIASLIPGSTPDSCMFKVLSLRHVRLSEKKWSQREECLLTAIVNSKVDKNWRDIAQELYKRNIDSDKIFRSSKQCKEHWICYLDNSIKKGPWEASEDKKLLSLILANHGAKKWADISRVFQGRTENALKNRYTLLIDRLKKESRLKDELEIIRSYLATQETLSPAHKTEETVLVEHRSSFRKPSEDIDCERDSRSPSSPPGEPKKANPLFSQSGVIMNTGNPQMPMIFCAPGSFFWMLGSQHD